MSIKSRLRTLLRRTGAFIFVFVASLISLSFIAHIPAVQKFGIQHLTGILSNVSGTQVSVGKFDFNFFSSLNLYDLYVETPEVEGDTLLYSQDLEVRFASLVTLVRRRLVLKDVELNNVQVNFSRSDSADVSTMTQLFDNFRTDKRKERDSTARDFLLEVGSLNGTNWEVTYADGHKNTVQKYTLEHGKVLFDEIDFNEPRIALEELVLDELTIDIRKLGGINREQLDPELDAIVRRPVMITSGRVIVNHGAFSLTNDLRPKSNVEGIDFKDLDLDDIHIDVSAFSMQDLNFEGQINDLAFKEQSGFELDSLRVDDASVTRQGIVLNGLKLFTPASEISDTIRFAYDAYSDFEDFENDVYMYAVLKGTRVSIADLLVAVPPLRRSAFFVHNEGNVMRIDGTIRGSINSLRASQLKGKLGDFSFEGDFRSRNLAVQNEQFLNLRLKRASASAQILRDLLPGVNLTSQYDLLGPIGFSGRFDGFLQDFVADGRITTDLGAASLDMRLDLYEGISDARYSGGIVLDSFDIGTWSRNPDLGRVSAAMQVLRGQGLTAQSANAELNGGVDLLEFKGYSYRNAVVNGVLDENFFDGQMEIEDENIDLTFSGVVDLRGEDPKFDFKTRIDTLNLTALNIIKDTFELAGIFEVSGSITPAQGINGTARASGVAVRRGVDELYLLDTIGIYSNPVGDTNHYTITSDYIKGNVDGRFGYRSFVPQLVHYLKVNYPVLTRNMADRIDSSDIMADIDFDITLSQPEEWSGIFKVDNLDFDRLRLKGGIDLPNDSLNIAIRSPFIRKDGFKVKYVAGELTLNHGRSHFEIAADSVMLNNYAIDSVAFAIDGENEFYDWQFGVKDLFDSLKMDLVGTFVYDTTGRYEINLDHERTIMFDRGWKLNLGNRIAWGPDYLEIDSFSLRNAVRSIEIADIDRRGFLLDIDNFDIHYVDAIWDYEKLDFGGAYSLDFYVDDVFNRQFVHAEFSMNDLLINDDSYGQFDVRLDLDGPDQPFKAIAELGSPEDRVLKADAWFDPSVNDERQNLNGNIELIEFPGKFLEYFLGGSIINTRGSVDGSITVYGDTSGVDFNGAAMVHGASTKVVVLGERYRLDDFEVLLTRDFIDLSNATVRDSEGNTGSVSGGLRHELLKDMTLDLELNSDRIIGLRLPKSNNAAFYGKGVGAANIRFTGPTKTGPSIVVNAITDNGTRIFLPLDQGSEESETFLRFVERDSFGNITVDQRQELLTGVNLEMNISITPQAQVDIIFNEYTRDILQGNGEGNIQINLNKAGDFTLYGGVEILGGKYLFTNLAVNKPFVLRPGGTITWSGDPYNALIDITADYAGLRASLTTLLEEYLVNASPNAQQEARQLTNVQLELLLTGSLLEPNIDFNIEFPDIRGELSGYVESKMKTLEANQSALNEQVFGLLWAGTFLPTNITRASGSSSIATVGIANTLSEFVSSQLSFFVSDFLQGAIEDVDFISGIDFDVGYNQSYDYLDQSATYSEWEVHVRNRLFNDRFIVDVGGSYVVDNPVVTQAAYFAGDYALEYVLTKDRRLKVRFYHRNEETIEGRRNKTGIGLSYRREFDNFGEWLRGLDSDAKKLSGKAKGDPGEQIFEN